MISRSFEFLRPHRTALASLAGFAERYAASDDPSSALVKLRTLADQIVEAIYDEERLPKPYRAGLNDLLGGPVFTALVPRVIPFVVDSPSTTRSLIRGAALLD